MKFMTGGILKSEYSISIPCVVVIFFFQGIGLKVKALLDLRKRFLLVAFIQFLSLGESILRHLPMLSYIILLSLASETWGHRHVLLQV